MAERSFTNSCAEIPYPCMVGENVVDPCSCQMFFQCETAGYGFVSRACGLGTAWNHQTGGCDTARDVLEGNGTKVCDMDRPWARCTSVKSHYQLSDLKITCLGPPTSTTTTTHTSSSSSENISAIVGGAVGAMVLIVCVFLLVFAWKRIRQPSTRRESRANSNTKQDSIQAEDGAVYMDVDETKKEQTEYDNKAIDQSSEMITAPIGYQSGGNDV